MNALTDLLLPRPLSPTWNEALLFGTFLLHLVFVLLMLGTGIIGFQAHLSRWAARTRDPRGEHRILAPFVAFEALAVVLGVGPLLLVQVGYTVSFFSAANILAPWWVLLVLLMVVGFLSFDLLEHRIEKPSRWNLALGIVGLSSLLAIPGVFVAILVLAEHPQEWLSAVRSRDRLTSAIGWIWLARYLHVLGAAVVIGSAYHLFRSTREDAARKRTMTGWLLGGVLFQIVAGAVLYALVLSRAERITHAFVGIAVAAALAVAAIAWATRRGKSVAAGWIPASALVTLLLMLLARETLQRGPFLAVDEGSRARAAAYERELVPHAAAALASYEAQLAASLEQGEGIYQRSCAFCHGADADGRGESARELTIPPEAIRDIRTTRAELYRILTTGVPASAMPAFTFYDRPHLDQLVDALDRSYGVLAPPAGVLPVKVSAGAAAEAGRLWAETCAGCHGPDGLPTPFGRRLRPAPPDLTSFGLTADATFAVIRDGYPGTMMRSFASAPEDVRWGLVELMQAKRGHR